MDPQAGSSDISADKRSTKGKKRKKKLNRKPTKKSQVRMQEEARIQAALAKQRYLEETKERVQLEWEENRVRSATYREQHENRIRDMERTFEILSEIERKWLTFRTEEKKAEEWKRYMTCDNLPDPTNLPEMNSYKFLWIEQAKDSTMADTLERTDKIMKLIQELDDIISDPGPNISETILNNWNILRKEMRELLQDQIDSGTYRIFRRIETEMEPTDMMTGKHYSETKHFQLRLWAEVITPIPSARPAEVRHPMKLSFDPLEIIIVLPVILLDVSKVIRVLFTKYDHWSDHSRTFDPPPVPPYHKKDLLQLAMDELNIRTEIVERRGELEQLMKKRIGSIPPQPTISQELLAWYCDPQRVLSDEVANIEDEAEAEWKNEARMMVNDFEVNLRERQFLGGLLHVDIYYQPPQPKYLRYKHDVTLLTEPPVLSPIEYLVMYPPLKTELPPDEDPTEKNIERLYQHLLEKRKSELINIRFRLPRTVYWFETPEIAHWNHEEECWFSDYIYGTSFDEEEQEMVFDVGVLGIFGLHVSRFCNFPYSDWRLEGDGTGGVNFYLKTSKVAIHFNIKENQVCLEQVENLPSKPFPGLLNTFYTPLKLVQMLKGFGIDVFPDTDTACYLPTFSPKHIVSERFIYQIWGLFSSSFVFKFSRFNRERGRRTSVFQIKQVHDSCRSDFCLIRTSPIDACILNINEESETYSPEPPPGIQVSTDLYNLIMDNCTSGAKRKAEATSFALVQTVRDLLGYIRPLSFS